MYSVESEEGEFMICMCDYGSLCRYGKDRARMCKMIVGRKYREVPVARKK